MSANAIETLRDRQASAKSYSVYGLEGKWLVDDDDWVSLHASIDDALAAVEALLEAAKRIGETRGFLRDHNEARDALAAAVRRVTGEDA